jgi:hypothetical protein
LISDRSQWTAENNNQNYFRIWVTPPFGFIPTDYKIRSGKGFFPMPWKIEMIHELRSFYLIEHQKIIQFVLNFKKMHLCFLVHFRALKSKSSKQD